MTKTEYKAYLQSPEWQKTRTTAITEAGSKCERCDLPRWLAEVLFDQDLHVHHKTYARKGAELLEDLEVLCRRCHEIETFKRSELRAPKESKCGICGCRHWDYRAACCERCLPLLCLNEETYQKLGLPDPASSGRPIWETLLREISCLAMSQMGGVERLIIVIAEYAQAREYLRNRSKNIEGE